MIIIIDIIIVIIIIISIIIFIIIIICIIDGIIIVITSSIINIIITAPQKVAGAQGRMGTRGAGRGGVRGTTGVCEQKHSSGGKHTWEDELSECQIRGWIAVSAAALQDKGLCKRSICFTDTGMEHDGVDLVAKVCLGGREIEGR